jgi:predicted dehydrogenase
MRQSLPTVHRLSRRTFVHRTALVAGALSVPSLITGCGRQEAPSETPASSADADARLRLVTLDPGHFHAALVQKSMYPGVSPVVRVYAPEGDELRQHLARVEAYNSRPDDPTHWELEVYTGPDFLDRMIADRAGDVVVIAGNNARKTEYIVRAIEAGFHVLADKPMVRTPADLERLEQAFRTAAERDVLLYDIMTERFEITNELQRVLSHMPDLFGDLQPGSPGAPSITKESVHHFAKVVSGVPLVRPTWFFDVEQQGEGIIDVTTHLVDLIQLSAYPEEALSPSDVEVLTARRWATPIAPAQFQQVTGATSFPDFLQPHVHDGTLHVYSNGEFTYRLRDVHARVSVTWNFEAPPGTGDTHFSEMLGTRARLVIRQGEEEGFAPVLYVERVPSVGAGDFDTAVKAAFDQLQERYPGVAVSGDGDRRTVTIPERYAVGHEAHFAQVTENFLTYVKERALPAWEVPYMLTKYATLMQAYEKSR